jgi:alkylation response protein AidB-like acyl-CoA dehydrogenase
MSNSMTTELEEAQQAYREAARDFAQAELAPHAARWDAEGIFPREAIAKAGELGFCGLYMDPEVGGSGLSRLDAAVVIEELANVDPSTAAYISIHNMASWMVSSWGQEALRAEWGQALSAGSKLASYCLTEPGAGSDAASLKTSAVRDGDHYVLNGAKAFISGAGATELLVVMARTGGPGASGISALAVPADLAGISYGRKEEKMGWNSQPTRGITFENVRVPVGNLLGEEGSGFKLAMKGLDGGRINIATCSSSWPTWSPSWWPRGRWCTPPRASSTPVPAMPTCGARWPSASPPTPASRSAMKRCRSTVATAIFVNTRSNACCATAAFIRSWRAPTRSCV